MNFSSFSSTAARSEFGSNPRGVWRESSSAMFRQPSQNRCFDFHLFLWQRGARWIGHQPFEQLPLLTALAQPAYDEQKDPFSKQTSAKHSSLERLPCVPPPRLLLPRWKHMVLLTTLNAAPPPRGPDQYYYGFRLLVKFCLQRHIIF